MNRTSGVLWALGLSTVALAGCGQEAKPVASMASGGGVVEIGATGFRQVELQFELLEELPADAGEPSVFVHLLDAQGDVVRTFDHSLAVDWWVGQTLRDPLWIHLSALGPRLPAGDYRLTAGIYDLERGKYALRTDLPRVAKQEYQVATVRVRGEGASDPRLELDGEWLPAEPDRDRQVLGARSLGVAGPGGLVLSSVERPGELFVRLALPRADGRDGSVDLEAGAPEVAVRLDESCSGEQRELSGAGTHDVVLAIAQAPADGTCRLELTPNFRLRPISGGAPSSVRVQAVSWNAAPPVGAAAE